jgi:hypothetical protein
MKKPFDLWRCLVCFALLLMSLQFVKCVSAQVEQQPAASSQDDALNSFLLAFRGKPVAAMPDFSSSVQKAAPLNQSQMQPQPPDTSVLATTQTNPVPSVSCPSGVERSGCPSVYVNSSRDGSPAGSCPPGYQRDPTGCVMPAMPSHAHRLAQYGGWTCDLGYVRSGGECEQLNLPLNAHLAANSSGWECNQGFYYTGQRCAPVFLPANSHLSADGAHFECDSGYRDIGMSCAP